MADEPVARVHHSHLTAGGGLVCARCGAKAWGERYCYACRTLSPAGKPTRSTECDCPYPTPAYEDRHRGCPIHGDDSGFRWTREHPETPGAMSDATDLDRAVEAAGLIAERDEWKENARGAHAREMAFMDERDQLQEQLKQAREIIVGFLPPYTPGSTNRARTFLSSTETSE